MVAAANMVEVAALVGDTARATMLAALMGGQSRTGTELAFLARVSRSTASEHLTKLVDAKLLAVTSKRRFHYYRIASPLVAAMLESIKRLQRSKSRPAISRAPRRKTRCGSARSCYDHLAGQLGVATADALIAKGHLVLAEDGGVVTEKGRKFLSGFGVNLTSMSASKRIFCRACLDWSERRYHVAGLVGSQLLLRFFELGWLVRERDTRALKVTPAGRSGLRDTFGIDLDASKAPAQKTPGHAAPTAARARR